MVSMNKIRKKKKELENMLNLMLLLVLIILLCWLSVNILIVEKKNHLKSSD